MEPQARFDLGRVINRATGAVGRNPGLFLALAVLLQGLPAVVTQLADRRSLAAADATVPRFTPGMLVAGLVGFVCAYLLQAAVTRATVIDLRGERPTLGESVKGGLRLVLPLFGLSLVFILGMSLGLLLLVVPGIIVAVMWSVSIPVMVEERKGVFASLGRSRELTKGSRWKIFAVFVLAMFLLVVPTLIAMIVAGAFATGGLENYQDSFAQYIVLVINALLTVALAVLLAAIYVELRFVKEGSSADDLASIFA
jgi:hypothetical protein